MASECAIVTEMSSERVSRYTPGRGGRCGVTRFMGSLLSVEKAEYAEHHTRSCCSLSLSVHSFDVPCTEQAYLVGQIATTVATGRLISLDYLRS